MPSDAPAARAGRRRAASAAIAAETRSHPASDIAAGVMVRAAPPASEAPSSASPSTEIVTAAQWPFVIVAPRARASTARTPTPPAELAWTSESGASASAPT